MPHGHDREGLNASGTDSTYECLRCGSIVEASSNPGACECGGQFQNRRKSLE
jgi:rubrerythrin